MSSNNPSQTLEGNIAQFRKAAGPLRGPPFSANRRRWMPSASSERALPSRSTPSPVGTPQHPSQPGSQSSDVVVAGSRSHVLVSPVQQGNPVLSHLGGTPKRFAPVLSDFVIGERCCVLYLSVRYHLLHTSRYLSSRISRVGRLYDLRIVLLHIDSAQGSVGLVDQTVEEVTALATRAGWTVICAWSVAECARWIESLKNFDPQSALPVPPRSLGRAITVCESSPNPLGEGGAPLFPQGDEAQRQRQGEFSDPKHPQLAGSASVPVSGGSSNRELALRILAMIPTVNRSDAESLLRHFGTPKAVFLASVDELQNLRGIGLKKAQRIYDALNQPIRLPLRHSAPNDTKIHPAPPPEPISSERQPPESGEPFPDFVDDDLLLSVGLPG